MNRSQIVSIAVLAFMLLIVNGLNAQWQTDIDYDFKIKVPTNWSKNVYFDGTDKVYDFYSPDENAAVQMRTFEAPAGLTLDLLVGVYEEQMIPAGAFKEGVKNHVSVTGIPGKQASYSFNYNGNQVGMGVFYAIQNGKAYVISAIIPVSMLEQKAVEVKSITQSFQLLSAKPTGNKDKFRVNKITLCDQLDYNNRAVNPKTEFSTKTPEIHAVVEYQGYTNKAITVKWIYKNNNRIITEDDYTFKKGQGGVGVVSLTKPYNDWPVGEYWVEFYEGPTVFKELRFDIKQSGSGGMKGNTAISGRYDLISRSDGQQAYNFLYYVFNSDGTVTEKHQPKGSGGYVGEHTGLWTANGNKLQIKFDWGTYDYEIQGKTLKHTDKQGVVLIYRKQ
ncbi:MAG: hypothetical protein C0598_03640 [Marinilabiliales bacterium]|nr:MAG: hypothetical protein C0598_03640 [Marinilabiliales bacterium]